MEGVFIVVLFVGLIGFLAMLSAGGRSAGRTYTASPRTSGSTTIALVILLAIMLIALLPFLAG